MVETLKLCSTCGAECRVLRRGMCKKHYERWRLHGDPTIVLKQMPDDRGTPRHGTQSKYAVGCRCDGCRSANAAAAKSWRHANRDKAYAAKVKWMSEHPGVARRSAWASEQRQRGYEVTAETVEFAGVLLADPCSYCGGAGGGIDHIIAQSQGGEGQWGNLTATCGSCNSRKHTKDLLQFLLAEVV